MISSFCVIIDDRDLPPPQLESLIGNMHFGDLLRRRKRYADELAAAAASADDVVVLKGDTDAAQLIRRIEAVRGETLWLRLPVVCAPLNMPALDGVIRKMRYALEPILLAPVFEDDAPAVLTSHDAIALLSAESHKERRSFLLRFSETAKITSHDVNFIDIREPHALRDFLASATEPRGFNEVSLEPGVFVKQSHDIAKMKAEFTYYQIAAPELQRFLLPTFGYEETEDSASYRMEHLRVPDAALQFVLGALRPNELAQLLDQFFAFVTARELEPVGRTKVQEVGTSQILTKMRNRLNLFLADPRGQQVEALLIAGGIDGGLRRLEHRAANLIECALVRYDGDALAFSHGDPCLSNILFETHVGLMRFIDPRGALTKGDAMMHPLYDVAKLSHSLCGGYDFVNNGLFSVETNETLRLELHRHRGGPPPWVRTAFETKLAAGGWDMTQVRAVEASLFLAMLPLHMDHPRKLLAFALISDEILNELESTP